MQHLYDLATTLGVQIEYADLTPYNRDGDYNHRTRTIRLQEGMMYRLERSVLAHELGHAHYGDEVSIFNHLNSRQERRADEWAARLLVDTTDYQHAEEQYGAHIEGIAALPMAA